MNDHQLTENADPSAGNAASPGAWRLDLRHASCGLMMGAADIIPGVSGGTVALILGIYTRLVTAISHFDSHLIRLLIERKWQSAWTRVDARFLLGLGTGIATGIIGLAKLMRYLLEYHHLQTLAVFFGLILGSTLLVARRIHMPQSMSAAPLWIVGAIAAGVAYWLVGLKLLEPKDETVGLVYVSCAAASRSAR
jgi:putative membrane protein